MALMQCFIMAKASTPLAVPIDMSAIMLVPWAHMLHLMIGTLQEQAIEKLHCKSRELAAR